MVVLKKAASFYNPMSIGNIEFERIHIMDGGTILHSFNWFTPTMNNSNAIDDGIYFHNDKLVRSKLTKNKLRYEGKKGHYHLYIDVSIMPIEQVTVKEDVYDMDSYKNTYFRVQGLEAYFYDRDKMPQNAQQAAYEKLYNKLDNERFSISDLKNAIEFYNNNEDLCNDADLWVK